MAFKSIPRELQDGRSFWTENNGFTFMMKDQRGKTQKVSESYYRKMKDLFYVQRKRNR